MERHLSYCDIFANWLRKQLKLGHKSFTHRDILNVTGSNCSYGVLRDLKFKFDFKESKAKSIKKFLDEKGKEITVTKQFKVYEVISER